MLNQPNITDFSQKYVISLDNIVIFKLYLYYRKISHEGNDLNAITIYSISCRCWCCSCHCCRWKKGHESYKNMKETKNIAESMENQYKTVFNIFDQARQDTNTQFEKYGELKLNILSGTMKEFLSEFKKLKMLILQIKQLLIPLKMYLILNTSCKK